VSSEAGKRSPETQKANAQAAFTLEIAPERGIEPGKQSPTFNAENIKT
jgi:hypothetical protein